MKKMPLFILPATLIVWITGCTSAPSPETLPQPLAAEMQTKAVGIIEAGGIAAIGLGESQSLDLALKKAHANGRIELAKTLQAKLNTLQDDFCLETSLPRDETRSGQFSDAAKIIIAEQIQDRPVQKIKYETVDRTVTAYALFEIDPNVITNALAKHEELYTRLQKTETFERLEKEIKKYRAYKTRRQGK